MATVVISRCGIDGRHDLGHPGVGHGIILELVGHPLRSVHESLLGHLSPTQSPHAATQRREESQTLLLQEARHAALPDLIASIKW